MNVNRVYIARIFVVESEEYFWEDVSEKKGNFVKNAIVYHRNTDEYIDLISGEKYCLGIRNALIGEMYINFKNNGIVPVAKLFDVGFKRNNMGKRRILKTLSNSKLLNKKEDDK